MSSRSPAETLQHDASATTKEHIRMPTPEELPTLDVQALRRTLSKISPMEEPDEWASTHLILGAALRARKARNTAEACEKIIDSFEAALEIYCQRNSSFANKRERPMRAARAQPESCVTLPGAECDEALEQIRVGGLDKAPTTNERDVADRMESEGIELVVQATSAVSCGAPQLLDRAIALFREISAPCVRERDFAQWIANLSNLGCALALSATAHGGTEKTAQLEEAVDAFRALLNEPVIQEIPSEFSTIHVNLAHTLKMLAEMALPSERVRYLESAIDSLTAALRTTAPVRFQALLRPTLSLKA